jgi:hypothetical protein
MHQQLLQQLYKEDAKFVLQDSTKQVNMKQEVLI